MTVATLNVGVSGDEVYCVWFDGKKKMGDSFPPDALGIVPGS